MAFYHKTVTSYSCASTGCLRTFQIFNSYRRHYLKNHSVLNDPLQSSTSKNVGDHSEDISDSLQNFSTESSNDFDNLSIPLGDSLAQFTSALYANPQVPLNIVDTVFNGVKDIFYKCLVPQLMEQDSAAFKESIVSIISKFDSDYKRLVYFKEHGSFVEPKAYTVGTRYDFVKSGGKRVYKAVECKAHFISLRIVLKKFFSLSNILRETLQHMNELGEHDSTQTIEHFIHGSSWKSRQSQHGRKLVMPVFLQVDDFEPLNALGSHSSIHKLGAAYISLPCLPPRYTSQLSNIFLALIYHSSDRVQFGNRVIFQPLIDELNFLLNDGIFIDHPDFKGTIYFDLGLILGDNLGLHNICGFVESFSANMTCRTCKVTRNNMIQLFQEDSSLLRDMNNYRQDLRTNNVSLTGVKEECIWLDVDNFNLFSHIGVDVMHDLNEGVMKYVMSEIIVALVDQAKYFSTQLFNNKLASFDYGPDKANIPVSLSIEHLRKSNLRLSSSEMATLCRYFGVMFGDLVPRGDKYWVLYIQLMLLLDVVMSSTFRPESTTYLQYLVSVLCEMYTSLFGQNLKPKFHNLLHYHSAMLKFGPLRYISSMRFEAKHRPNKLISKSSQNRINMSYTIAKRHQLILNDIFLQGELKTHINFGEKTSISFDVASVLAQEFGWNNIEKIKSVTWVTISSTRYARDCVLVSGIETENVNFSIVTDIYIYNDRNVVFKALPMNTIAFDDHYFAYQVENPPLNTQSIYINCDTMQYPYPCNITIVGYGDVQPLQYVILRVPL
jgi:hypothetical protein